MCRAKGRFARSLIVAHSALVWAQLDEGTHEEHLEEFIETGQFGQVPKALPYNPAVMEAIAKNWTWTK